MIHCIRLNSPAGRLTITEEGGAVTRLTFGDAGEREESSPLLEEAARQLAEYFDGRRRVFELPLNPSGTAFQKDVWRALCGIPYGETRSYSDIARAIHRETACRAVGMANHRNPIPIFIPCHRVIGADGSLAGYGGGTGIKKILLQTEGVRVREKPSSPE